MDLSSKVEGILSNTEAALQARVNYAGWQATLYTLRARGWRNTFSVDQAYARMQLALLSPDRALILKAEVQLGDLLSRTRTSYYHPTELDLLRLKEWHINQVIPSNTMLRMVNVSTTPGAYMESKSFTEVGAMKYYGFEEQTAIEEPQGLIVDPDNVMQVLEMIKQAQSPEQARIRERARRGEIQPKLNAQVFSIAS